MDHEIKKKEKKKRHQPSLYQQVKEEVMTIMRKETL
jgi:hypothetical protein